MEINTIKKTKKELELEIIGEDETLLNPIKQRLLEENEVEYAEYFIDHPLTGKPRLYIKTRKEDPLDVLKKTLKSLEKDVSKLTKELNEKLKKK
ncbi:MAG: DNA-directed RNA polymerase subunit L [Thermoplasmata archaeon]|nr:DNA-directed RNA polymerase subunit L [Thermoplasmata archaeon]